MTSTPRLDLHTSYATENKRASSAAIDADHAAIEAWAQQLLQNLAKVIRDDDTLKDKVVAERNLTPSLMAMIQAAALGRLPLPTPEQGKALGWGEYGDLVNLPVAPSAASGGPGSSKSVVSVRRSGYADDATGNLILGGSGESSYDVGTASTRLAIGSGAKEPGRIYAEGRQFLNAGQPQYLNGVNTPWHIFNEFGQTGGGAYDSAWWEAEFDRLVDRGVNAVRVWVVCSCANVGVTLNEDGTCNPPTALFWSNVDDMVARAAAHGLFVMPTMMSFDNWDWNNAGQERWVRMLGDAAGIQSLIDNYLVPFVERYKDNPWVFAVDLCNEMDWLYERGDLATPRAGTCTPVGGGSNVVNFGQRVPDHVVGMHLYVNNVDLGLVTARVSDTQVTTAGTFGGASATYTVNVGNGWTFTGWTWASIQRYLAMASAAIHDSQSTVMVTMGMGTIKYGSQIYDGDHYTDAALAAITGNGASRLDFHQIHWYGWAQPWYRLLKSPTQHGLTAKPAMMGELPMNFAGLNMPNLIPWRRNTYLNIASSPSIARTGLFTRRMDGSFPRLYMAQNSGMTGLGAGPAGTGTIVDGAVTWISVNNMYQPNHEYAANDMLICDHANTGGIGRIYICTAGGTTGNDGGPYGTANGQVFGTTTWDYVGEAIVDERTAYDFFLANGWVGHMPWMSNGLDFNLGLYETDLTGNYPIAWAPLTDYYVNEMRTNDGNKLYRCITTGKSAAAGGPTGTGADITDGAAHWAYVETLADPPWTTSGLAIRAFADANGAAINPDTSGPWDNRGTAVLQSKGRAWHKPGETIRFSQRFQMGPGASNVTRRVGAFDAEDGVFLSAAAAGLALAVRNRGVDTPVAQADWNLDSLPSLDVTQPQTLVIDFAWMGGSKVGFLLGDSITWVHSFDIGACPSNPNLPLRWEVGSEAAVSGIHDLTVFDGAALSDRLDAAPKRRSWDNGFNSLQVGGRSFGEAMAIRVAPGSRRWASLRPTGISIQSASTGGTYRFQWWLELDPSVSNSTAWLAVPGSDVAEYTTGRGIAAAGRRIASGFGVNSFLAALADLPTLLETAGGGEVLSLQIRNIELVTDYYMFSLEWDEGTP